MTDVAALRKNRLFLYAIEIGKWLLILWLILPVTSAYRTKVDFVRVALGIILFIIFAGKLFYDVVYFPQNRNRSKSTGRDLLSLFGIVTVIALVVCVLVVFVAMIALGYMQQIVN